MNDPKNFLQSKTLWSLLVMVLAFVITKYHPFGLGGPGADVASQAQSITDWVCNLLVLVGAGGVAYGRIAAKQTLTILPGSGNTTDSGSTLKVGGLLLVVFLALGTLSLAGCQATENHQAATNFIVAQGHANTVHDLIAAKDKAGNPLLTKNQADSLLVMLHGESNASDAYYAAIKTGDKALFAAAKSVFEDATRKLAVELLKYALPATTPLDTPPLGVPATRPG